MDEPEPAQLSPPAQDQHFPDQTQDENPSAAQDQYSPAAQDQYPPSALDQYPPAAQDQYPPAAQDQYPAAAQDQYPPATQDQYPPATQDQYPPAAQNQYPPAAQDQYPPATQDQDTPAAQDQDLLAAQDQYPPAAQGQYPPAAQGQYPPTAQDHYLPAVQDQYPTQSQEQPPVQPMPMLAQPQLGPQPTAEQTAPREAWQPSEGYRYEGEVPDEDVDANATDLPPMPTAPPPIIAVVPGYEEAAFTGASLAGPPPAYTGAVEDTTIDTDRLPQKIKSLSHSWHYAEVCNEWRVHLRSLASGQHSFQETSQRQRAVGDTVSGLTDLVSNFKHPAPMAMLNNGANLPVHIFQYSLESYSEERSTKWKKVPYPGGYVDGPSNGPAPGPWEISCGYKEAFKDEKVKTEVPHTASVHKCHVCHGKGYLRCNVCQGRGKVRCCKCLGSGEESAWVEGELAKVTCSLCDGTKRTICGICNGHGCVQCRECEGFGELKHFIQLKVKYKKHTDTHIIERTDMPDDLIKDAEGDTILEQVGIRVGPVIGFIEEEINQKSFAFVQKHATARPEERILQQRQELRAVPVNECRFKFDDEEGRFWVYGKQRAVYTNDYPHTCFCCSCTIL